MKKLLRLLKIQRSARVKKPISNEPLSGERAGLKAEAKAYLTLPMTFDFTAYFDDNEPENSIDDIPNEKETIDTNTEVFCMNGEGNEIRFSSTIQQFECCIN
jgi:hypothetical protein